METQTYRQNVTAVSQALANVLKGKSFGTHFQRMLKFLGYRVLGFIASIKNHFLTGRILKFV